MHSPAPLRLLRSAEHARSAPPHPRLARGGPICRVLTTDQMTAAIGEPRLATTSVTFTRFREAPKVYEASADGTVVEAGMTYEFDVFEDGDVRLWRDDRKVSLRHKGALRATVMAVYRAAQGERALAALSAGIDRAVVGAAR